MADGALAAIVLLGCFVVFAIAGIFEARQLRQVALVPFASGEATKPPTAE